MHRRGDLRPAMLLLAGLLAFLSAGSVFGQSASAAAAPAPANIPRPEELEPGVDTTQSAPPAAAPNLDSAAAASTTPPPAAPRSSAAANGAATNGTTNSAATNSAATNGTAPKSAAGAKAAGRKGPDRLELETTDVTGNSELPKVLYIVPWKRSDLGDMVGRPVNSLLDEVLQPLDRDVFNRQNRYYDALKPGDAAAKSDAAQGSGGKP
jgi:hypothetical protein